MQSPVREPQIRGTIAFSGRRRRGGRRMPHPRRLLRRSQVPLAVTATSSIAKTLRRRLLLVVLVELLARHLLLGHVRQFENEVNNLVLIDRCTKLGQRIGVVAIV